MKRSLLALGLGLALAATAQAADIRLVIHGGAGTMAREDFTPERAAKLACPACGACRCSVGGLHIYRNPIGFS